MNSLNSLSLLRFLQLTSPGLPVGAYSYSEGLESLVEQGIIADRVSLEQWLIGELQRGSIRVDGGIMVRSYQAIAIQDWYAVKAWNQWLSAAREAEELRLQSWQMGRSLVKLLKDVSPEVELILLMMPWQDEPCNFAVAYAIAATCWQIDESTALLGYLFSWAANLVNAGIRLMPLGQTAGQQTLLTLGPHLERTTTEILQLSDAALESCSWGLAMVTMSHEIQYSRLFRS